MAFKILQSLKMFQFSSVTQSCLTLLVSASYGFISIIYWILKYFKQNIFYN